MTGLDLAREKSERSIQFVIRCFDYPRTSSRRSDARFLWRRIPATIKQVDCAAAVVESDPSVHEPILACWYLPHAEQTRAPSCLDDLEVLVA